MSDSTTKRSDSLRLLSWNILHGGGKRATDILEAIAAEKPDIVTLQEFRNGANRDELVDGLLAMGLEHQFIPETSSNRDNTVIVASKLPFEASSFPGNISNAEGANAIKATFKAPIELTLFAVHLPHKQKQLPYLEALLDLPQAYRNQSSVIMGDFNCGIPFEDSETKSFYATHLFQQLLKDGWVDAWRSRNPKKREFTWISTKQQNGFRYDHALVSSELDKMLSTIRYQHEVRLSGVSDHSMLLVQLKFKLQHSIFNPAVLSI